MTLGKYKDRILVKDGDNWRDAQTNVIVKITPEEAIEVIKVSFTLWQIIKQFIGLIGNIFKKK
jgi:hypothetical protein